MINIIKDKEAIYETENYDVVLIGTTTHCLLCGSFQCKMGYKYPIIEKVNNSTNYGDLNKLGKRLTITDNKPIISLLYICKYPPPNKSVYVDYEALEKCLTTANAEFKGKKVMTTILGASQFDGRGDREKCLEIMERCLTDVDVDVYDYNIIKLLDERTQQWRYFQILKNQHKKDKKKIKEIEKLEEEMAIKTFITSREKLEKTKANRRSYYGKK